MESVSPLTLSRQTHTTRAVVQGWLSDRVREPSNPEFSLFTCYLCDSVYLLILGAAPSPPATSGQGFHPQGVSLVLWRDLSELR